MGGWREFHSEELHHLLIKYCYYKHVNESEMGGACRTHGRNGRTWTFQLESLKGREHLEDPSVDSERTLKYTYIRQKWCGFVD
jgi:hypothetical protein